MIREMYVVNVSLLSISCFACFMTFVSGEWVEIPAISSNYEGNNSKSSYLNNRPQYNKTYVFERIVLKQSPTREMELSTKHPTIAPSRFLVENYHSSDDPLETSQPPQMISSNLTPPKILSTTPPPQILSSNKPPPQTLPSNKPPPQTLPSNKPPPQILPSSSSPSPIPSRKNENNRVEEHASPSFKGIPGLLFTTRMKDIIMGVHKTLSSQPSHTITGKLKYLEQIKNHLLQNIWERSRILWRGNSISRSDSRSMSYFPSGGGEGPLITIALLTFAVFLIKIVQQFIQGLQGAAAANTVQVPTATQGGRGGGRVKRWSDDRYQEATKMLHYMERYKFHSEL